MAGEYDDILARVHDEIDQENAIETVSSHELELLAVERQKTLALARDLGQVLLEHEVDTDFTFIHGRAIPAETARTGFLRKREVVVRKADYETFPVGTGWMVNAYSCFDRSADRSGDGEYDPGDSGYFLGATVLEGNGHLTQVGGAGGVPFALPSQAYDSPKRHEPLPFPFSADNLLVNKNFTGLSIKPSQFSNTLNMWSGSPNFRVYEFGHGGERIFERYLQDDLAKLAMRHGVIDYL